MAYTTLAQLEKIEADIPRNSKAFKKQLREMTAKDVQTLLLKVERIRQLTDMLAAPLEDSLLAKVGYLYGSM